MTIERIAKRIAASGICSRRDAEKLILAGRVEVNGKKITSPALNVSANDEIKVHGQTITKQERARLWAYNKPKGLLTTHKDPEGRPTVFDQLPDDMPRVISIGRLDMNSEGLLLLTTSGELARKMEHPSAGLERIYRVRVFGKPKDKELQSLSQGLTVEGIHYGSILAELERETGSHSWLIVTLREGKNREIRNVFEHMGYPVTRLIRISYGSIQLGKLEPGKLRELPEKSFQQYI